MLTVHHLGVSQSERIVWLCEELDLPYTLQRYTRDATTRMAPDDYKALHPLGTAPVITDGDVVLAESGAIAAYLLGRYGAGRLALPPEDPAYPDYLFWLHFANGSLMPYGMFRLVATMLEVEADDPRLGFVRGRTDAAYALMERHLSRATWFAGETFTAADIMMGFPLTTMRAFAPKDLAAYPALRDYLRRIGKRPAYRRGMDKGDPGMAPMLD